jgi:hypothetical protein
LGDEAELFTDAVVFVSSSSLFVAVAAADAAIII